VLNSYLFSSFPCTSERDLVLETERAADGNLGSGALVAEMLRLNLRPVL
jgi:hypothetical protein